MKLNLFKRNLVGAILGFCLLVGIGFASTVTTQAQWQRDPQWQNDQWRRQQQYERERLRRQRQWEREQRRQQSNNGYYDNYNYGVSFDFRQTALNAGYNQGIKEGRKDRERNEPFEYRDEGAYQDATTDYSSRLGNLELYRQYYRQGFANGYRDGYRGY